MQVYIYVYNLCCFNLHLGSIFFTWMGPKPMVHPKFGNPLASLYGKGLVDANGDQWVKHRKIINPALYVEKIKHMLPAFYIRCSEMINKWEGITKGGSCEVDVYPHLQTVTSDVISRTAFGSSYEEGRKIFEVQVEQATLVIKAMQSIYIPGSRKGIFFINRICYVAPFSFQ
ncbi:putative 11-oxo-beta-amyrin 30-oxidase [Helianthus anomalus]